jgi:hypothetical protein
MTDEKDEKRRVAFDLDAEDHGALEHLVGRMKLSKSDVLRLLIRDRAKDMGYETESSSAA